MCSSNLVMSIEIQVLPLSGAPLIFRAQCVCVCWGSSYKKWTILKFFFPQGLASSLLRIPENRAAQWMPLILLTWVMVEIEGKILRVSLVTFKKISISDEQLRNSRNCWGNEVDINPSRNVAEFSLNNRFTLFYLFSPGYQLNRHFDRSELHILATLNSYLINGC